MSATRLPAGVVAASLAALLALGACMSDASTGSRGDGARTDGSCFIGGCAAELCSDHAGMVSPCIWRDAYVCFRDATCERQASGACGWTATPELTACLAAHDPL